MSRGVNEGVHVGMMTYVHLRVGRNDKDEPLKDNRFIISKDDQGKIARVRIRRGSASHAAEAAAAVFSQSLRV